MVAPLLCWNIHRPVSRLITWSSSNLKEPPLESFRFSSYFNLFYSLGYLFPVSSTSTKPSPCFPPSQCHILRGWTSITRGNQATSFFLTVLQFRTHFPRKPFLVSLTRCLTCRVSPAIRLECWLPGSNRGSLYITTLTFTVAWHEMSVSTSLSLDCSFDKRRIRIVLVIKSE